jgi:hypothetical protein
MLSRIMSDPGLPVILSRMDFDIAERSRGRGCPHCGGCLHSARYPRMPWCTKSLSPDWDRRYSFCCANKRCRRRTTPESVRFFGRRLYPAVFVVLVSALMHGVTGRRLQTIRTALSVDRRTLERWRRWWRETFPQTRFFKEVQARLLPPVDQDSLPQSLLLRFGKGSLDSVVSLLRFLAPCGSDPGLVEGAL